MKLRKSFMGAALELIPFRKSGIDLTSGCKLVRRWNDFLNGDDSWPPSTSGVRGLSDDEGEV